MSKESSNKRQAKEVEREQLVAVSVGARVELCGVGTLVVNTFQRRRFASQMKPIQDCHPERSEGSLSGERSFAALRMTKRDGLLFEMYCPQGPSTRRKVVDLCAPHADHLVRE